MSGAVMGLVALLAVGCSHGSDRPAAAPTTSVPRPTSTAVATVPASTGVSGPTTSVASSTVTTASPAPAHCATAGLSLSVVDHGAAAGTGYKDLVFKNTSARACTLVGYPGAAFLDAHGVQIGAPAARSGAAGAPVTVAPGATTVAQLAYHDVYVSTAPGCQPTTASSLRVFPPNETAALVVPVSLLVCANPAASGTADISVVKAPSALNP